VLHLVAVHDGVEGIGQSRALQGELDIGALSVRAKSLGTRKTANKFTSAGDDVLLKNRSHHLAEQCFFFGAVAEIIVRGNLIAPVCGDDRVVAAAVHGRLQVSGIDSVLPQINFPSLRVKRHGVDNYTVKIEEERGHLL
jgi:hypothetical protein